MLLSRIHEMVVGMVPNEPHVSHPGKDDVVKPGLDALPVDLVTVGFQQCCSEVFEGDRRRLTDQTGEYSGSVPVE